LESSVANYTDNVYRQLQFGLSGAIFDLERIEILKGAQGTLYGKNASAGVINIITKKPSLDEVGGYMKVAAGAYEGSQGGHRAAGRIEGIEVERFHHVGRRWPIGARIPPPPDRVQRGLALASGIATGQNPPPQ